MSENFDFTSYNNIKRLAEDELGGKGPNPAIRSRIAGDTPTPAPPSGAWANSMTTREDMLFPDSNQPELLEPRKGTVGRSGRYENQAPEWEADRDHGEGQASAKQDGSQGAAGQHEGGRTPHCRASLLHTRSTLHGTACM